jgi:dipeptidyl aminopeptidase/acylaminoacyl peptidase
MLRRIFILAVGLTLAGSALAIESKPLEHYFKKAEYAGFQLSPDGKRLGVLAPYKDRMNLVIMNVDMSDGRFVTAVENQDVSSFMWATNDRLLFFMDKDGSESFGIFAVNADGSQPKTLVEPAELRMRGGAAVIRYTQVLNVLEDDPENVLVINNERNARYPDVYRMDIMTGRKREVMRNPGNVVGWFVDWDGKIIGAGYNDELHNGFLMYDEETEEWEEVTRTRYDEHGFSPAGLSGDGENGYVSSNLTPDGKPRDKAAIYRYNFKTRQMGELVFEHPRVDVAGVIMSEKTRDMIGVGYMVGTPERVFTDSNWKATMEAIDEALPDTINAMTSTDDEETIGVLTAYSSTQPPRYYLYDFEARTLKYLADSRSWIKPAEMAETRSVEFKARDGMLLQGYLTLPPGSDGKNLPTVVNPHGGPWARDGWGYNPEIQFLASRGYAVLQVNFRGSTGFGMDHWLASRRQWGQSMQSDISDMLQWAVDQGISDSDRVCIYGGSYGGYAVMAGLTFTPELYKCGINYVGVTDIALLFETAPDSWGGGMAQMKELVGDPKRDKEFLEEWSPSNHADKIQAPVFMAYGRQDPRVNIKHAKLMEDALKKHNKEYELMVKKDEGHGFRKQENQYDFYGKMETFLAQHLNP